ncbi:MAG: SDR family oxidoreductase [Dehalococcoidia bacterium]|nr:SDR family oxidoreductase [Dehalococcoidia bacterium]
MRGRVCLVTGASSGIGRAAAEGLARMGATVVMVCRNAERGEQAKRDIQRRVTGASLELLLADLASQSAVRRLAHEFKSRHKRLHVLVHNAGVIYGKRTLTEEGLETTFAVNHLAPFLLTNLLLDVLKASAPARVVVVGSGAHRFGSLDFTNLQGERRYAGGGAYAMSKLANLLYTFELAHRLEGTVVTVNCMHPGFVASNFGRGTANPLYRLIAFFGARPEKGADTILYLATSPEVEGVTGKYFFRRREKQPSKQARDSALAAKLWEVSAALTERQGLR